MSRNSINEKWSESYLPLSGITLKKALRVSKNTGTDWSAGALSLILFFLMAKLVGLI